MPAAGDDAARVTLAAQQCTQVPQNGAGGPFSPICVHSFALTAARAILASQQCTRMTQNGAEGLF